MPGVRHSIEVTVGGVNIAVSGTREFVEEKFEELKDEYSLGEIEVSEAPEATATPAGTTKSAGGLDKTLNEYLADSDISSKRDRALAVGWYLEDGEGVDAFTRAQIETKATESKIGLGKNVSRDLSSNVSDGYLHPAGEREGEDTFWVTDTGREYLADNGIPATL